jgi:hypothetical protein
MATTIQLIDEAIATERIGRLAHGRVCLDVTGELINEIADWLENHPGLPFTVVSLRSGGELHQLWVLLNAFEAQHEHVRVNNRALMLFKQSWMASELDVVWIVPPNTRTILYTF